MRYIVCCLTLLLLSACIDVDDFGPCWDNGKTDAAITGSWKLIPPANAKDGKEETYVVRIEARGDLMHITFTGDDKEPEVDLARSLSIGKAKFLMIKKDETPLKTGGMLLRYALEANGELAFYTPEKRPETAFLKDYKGKSIEVGKYSFKIKTLTPEALSDLEAMANAPGAFVEAARYRKD